MTKQPVKKAKKQEIPEAKNVHEAINHVMGRVGYVQKEKAKELKYTISTEAAFIQAVRPHMVDVGLIVYQSAAELLERNEFTSRKGAQGINLLVRYTWTWHHTPSNTFLFTTSLGEAADYGDKAANKTMTVAMKYALRQTLLIETGDDPDYTDSKEFEMARERKAEEMSEARQPFTEHVGKKQWPPNKAENLRAALIAAKVLPPDAHNIHIATFLDLAPFSIEVPTKDMVGWAKLYRGYKDETDDTDEAVRMATEAWFSGDDND